MKLSNTSEPTIVTHDVYSQFGAGTVLAAIGVQASQRGLDLAAITAFLAAAGVFLTGLSSVLRQAQAVWVARLKDERDKPTIAVEPERAPT